MSLKFTIVSATNVPANDSSGTSDPYAKVFVEGTVSTYIGKTSTIEKSVNPVWNNQFSISPVRGMKVKIEIYDYNKRSSDTLIAHCHYDPTCYHLTRDVEISLTNDIEKGGENSSLKVCAILENPPKYPPLQQKFSFQTPFYITLDPSSPVSVTNPLSPIRFLPFMPPAELALLSIKGADPLCAITSSGHRENPGSNHSGRHPCHSISSFTQTIRVDPAVAAADGITSIVIIVYSPSLASLSSISASYSVTIWKSNEIPKEYQKGKPIKFKDNEAKAELVPVQRFVINPTSGSQFASVAVGSLIASKTASCDFNEAVVEIPSKGFNFSGQTFDSVAPVMIKMLKITNSQLKVPTGFPILSPVSLEKFCCWSGIPICGTVGGRYSGDKDHHFLVTLMDYQMQEIDSCSPSKPKIQNDLIKMGQAGFDAKYSDLDRRVKFICVSVYGQVPFGASSQPGAISLTAASTEIQKEDLPRTKTNNTFLWFVLFKDAFGAWSLLYICDPCICQGWESVANNFRGALIYTLGL